MSVGEPEIFEDLVGKKYRFLYPNIRFSFRNLVRALGFCIKNKTKQKSSDNFDMEPGAGNTTLSLAKHLKHFREFLINKNAE